MPATFVPGVGLTAFKVRAEFLIIGLYVLSGGVLWWRMRGPQAFNAAALFGAVCAMALSECFFTLYLRVHDVYNLMGHLYKVIAYLFLYRAVFVEVIEEPYREMAAMRDQLKATLDAVPDVMLEMDLQGRYHAVHTPQPDLLVRPQDDLVGKTVHEVLPPEDAQAVTAALQEALIHGRSVGTQLELPVPQGRRWFELSVSRKGTAMETDTRFIVLSRDVTERRQAEAAIRAQEAANQASRAKSEFLSRMSHELRTPLNAVIGFGQLLLHSGNARLTGGQKLYVEHILSAGQHLLEMINDILDLTRIESGHSDVVVEPVRVGTWLADSLPMVLPQAEARGVAVLAEKALGDQREILGDPRRLKQVLINVLSNAIKYNHSGGRVAVTSELQGDELALIIADTGCGMTAEQLKGLFEPFNRLGAERAGIEGTGLGLVISRRLVEAMGGVIEVDSTPGTGTVVTLRLPRAAPGQTPATTEVEPGPGDEAPAVAVLTRATVLCIEDNPLNAALLRAIFDLRPELT
ncbi:MAG TPA: ATP-binding protein, partial [Aquabacterium sp.]|nr:ATP-binding protein [Aquabacterium sp.]